MVVAVGHVRDPAVQYIVAGGALQNRSLFFWSQFSSVKDAVSTFLASNESGMSKPFAQVTSFLKDYSAALTRAQAFDSKVQSDASAISTDYASIAALSVRQAFGATELTVSKNSAGGFNTSDVLMFMKGSDFTSRLSYQGIG